jgi:hypothetical protein
MSELPPTSVCHGRCVIIAAKRGYISPAFMFCEACLMPSALPNTRACHKAA